MNQDGLWGERLQEPSLRISELSVAVKAPTLCVINDEVKYRAAMGLLKRDAQIEKTKTGGLGRGAVLLCPMLACTLLFFYGSQILETWRAVGWFSTPLHLLGLRDMGQLTVIGVLGTPVAVVLLIAIAMHNDNYDWLCVFAPPVTVCLFALLANDPQISRFMVSVLLVAACVSLSIAAQRRLRPLSIITASLAWLCFTYWFLAQGLLTL